MNRLLPALLIIIALVVGAVVLFSGDVLVARAQYFDAFGNEHATQAQSSAADSSAATAESRAAGAVTSVAGAATNPGGENIPAPPKSPADLSFFGGVMISIMKIFAWLLGVAMVLLDTVVFYTVVTMGDYIKSLAAIGVVWHVLRDIGNILLIFGFLAAGIGTILNVSWYGFSTKMLPMLLVAAVFLNFSLFISEAVIDVGNLFATQFYTQINGNIPAGSKSFSNEGISTAIMSKLGLATLYGEVRNESKILTVGNSLFVGLMGILLFLVTAFVMLSLAFILIARFIVLIFLIILAPVGFAGLAIPKLGGLASQWWSALFEQTITAPVLLLLLYIALKVILDRTFLIGSNPDWLGVFKNTSASMENFAGLLLSFIVAMGLLLAVVMFAKKMSAFGASTAIKWGGRLSFGATALGASALTGGTAFALRRGVIQRLNPTSRFGRSAQRLASRGLRFTEGVRMDTRSIPGVGAGLAAMGATEASTSIERSTAGRVAQGVEWLRHSGDAANRQFDQETRIPRLRAAIAANNQVEIARLIGNMSDKELEEGSVQRLIANSPVAVAVLTQTRFDKLMTSDVLSDAQKNGLRTQRIAGIQARYTNAPHPDPRFAGRTVADVTLNGAPSGPGGIPPRVPGMSSTQRAELDGDILALPHVMALLTAGDFNAIARRAQIEGPNLAAISAHLNALAHPAPGAPATPLGAQIAALAATNRGFAAFFGLP